MLMSSLAPSRASDPAARASKPRIILREEASPTSGEVEKKLSLVELAWNSSTIRKTTMLLGLAVI